jgi:WD40 repeat protein
MPEIFVSYSRRDKAVVQTLVDRLIASGRDVWVDWQDIPWTADWWREISEGIEHSDNFVFVLSPASLSSLVCNFEVAHAIAQNKRIVPIVIEQADQKKAHELLKAAPLDDVGKRILHSRDLDDVLDDNWQYLARHNWLFFNDPAQFDRSFANLTNALDTDLDHVRDHTRFLVQAREWDTKERDSSFLLVGKEIAEAERWLSAGAAKVPPPTQLHSEHVYTSRQHATNQQRQVLVGVSIGLVVTVILAIAAFGLWRQASFERDRADQQAQIARSGRVSLQGLLQLGEGHLDSALLLAVQAIGIRDSRESRSSLLTSLQSAPRLDRFLQTENPALVDWIAYRPDGKQAAVSDVTGRIVLWDTEKMRPSGEPLLGHEGDVWGVAYSPDGQTLASVGADGILRLWDVVSGMVKTESEPFDDEIFCVAYSPDGQLIATGHADYGVRLWDAQTGELLNESLDEHEDYVETLSFSPDSTLLASGSDDNQIILWNVTDPQDVTVEWVLEGHENAVLTLAFSPDGERLASGSADNTLRLWTVDTGEEIGLPLTDHIDWVGVVRYSPDGSLLVSASDDATLIFRDPANGRRLEDVPPLSAHSNAIGAFAFSPDSEHLISGDEDGNILLWNIHQDQPLSRVLAHEEAEVDSLAFSPDGTRLLSGSHAGNAEGSATVWDAQTGASLFDPFKVEREVVAVAYSPDGSLFAYGIADGTLVLRSTSSGEALQTLQAHAGSIRDIAFSPDSKRIASASEDGSVRLWQVSDLSQVAQLQHEPFVKALAFSPDGTWLALGDESGGVALWNREQTAPREFSQAHSGAISSITFNHRGDTLASASRDNTVLLWDVSAGVVQGLPLSGHDNWVLDVAFSPDDQMLASSSRDDTIVLWDVTSQHMIGAPLEGAGDWVWSIAFSPDGKTLASGSRNGDIRLWVVDPQLWIQRACTVAGRPLNAEERNLYLADVTTLSTACDMG